MLAWFVIVRLAASRARYGNYRKSVFNNDPDLVPLNIASRPTQTVIAAYLKGL